MSNMTYSYDTVEERFQQIFSSDSISQIVFVPLNTLNNEQGYYYMKCPLHLFGMILLWMMVLSFCMCTRLTHRRTDPPIVYAVPENVQVAESKV